MTFATVGTPSSGVSGLTMPVTATNVGDFILLGWQVSTGGGQVIGATSSNAVWAVLSPAQLTAGSQYGGVLIGYVIAPGTATVTFTVAGTISSLQAQAQEFSTSVGLQSLRVDTQGVVPTGSGNLNFPKLNPWHGNGELYFCYSANTGVYTNGTTAGFSYSTIGGNTLVWNPSCGVALQAPTAGSSTGVGWGVGILLWEQNGQPVMNGFTPDQVATPVSNLNSGTITITWPVAPTPGSKVLVMAHESGASNVISVVDNGVRPTNFNSDNLAFNGAQHCWLFRGDNITLPLVGPYQVTITWTATANAGVSGASWLGLASGGPVSGSGGVFGSGTGPVSTSNSITPTIAGCLLVATVGTNNSSTNPENFFFNDPGWTSLGSQGNPTVGHCGTHAYATSPSSASLTTTCVTNDSPAWLSIVSAYAPATSTIQRNAGLTSEMQLGGTWQDVSTWVMQRDAVTISRGRQNEASGMQAGNQTETLKNADGRFTLRNPSSALYPNLLQNSPIRASIPSYYGGIPSYLRMQTDDISGIQTPDVPFIHIQHYTAGTAFSSSGTSKSQTIPATTQGSTLIAVVAYGNVGWTTVLNSVQAGGRNFNKISAPHSNVSFTSIWELPNCPAGTTSVTANFSVASFGNISVYEVFGLDPAGSADRVSSAGGTVSPASSGASGTTNQAAELVIGAISAQATSVTGTGSGFTNNAGVQWGTAFDGAGDVAFDSFQVVTATGTFTDSATYSGGSGTGFSACVATFRANANGIGIDIGNVGNNFGMISARIDCKITDWQHNHVLMSKYGTLGKSWALWTNGTGFLTFDIFDGATDHFVFSSVPVPYFSGRIAIRVDYDITNQTVVFYTAPNMGGPWTQLGITQITNSTSLAAAHNQPVTVGFGSTQLPGMYGEVYEAALISDGKIWDFENANELNDWSTNGGTLSISTTQANTGSHSLLLTSNGTANTFVDTTFFCAPGSSAGGNFFVFSSRAQTASIAIDWFDAFGTYLSTSGPAAVSLAANTWTQLTLDGVFAPARAQQGHLYLSLQAPTNTDLVYLDTINFFGCALFDVVIPFGIGGNTDLLGNIWTVQGTAELSAKLYRFHGEWAQSPKNTDPTTKDVFIQATAYGMNQRISNSNTPLNSPMRRSYKFLPSAFRLVDYWPMEDGPKSNSFGSALGGSPMTISGNPTLASNGSFVCSAPIPVLNGATFIAPVRTSTVTWQDNVVRILFSLPASDDTNNAFFINIYTNGTCALARVQYGTGGVLNFSGYNAAGATLFNTGAFGFGLAELANCRISAELTFNSGSVTNYALWVLTANGTTANGVTPGTFAGSIGGVTQVTIGGGLVGSAVGHLSVQAVSDGINDLINPLIGWAGEAAATRFARICTEEGLPVRIMGPTESSQVMGVQPIDTLANILQQCEATDQGQQYEPRDALALGYRTIRGLYNQQIMSSPLFGAADLYTGFGSTADTQLTVNDVTANAADGSIARATLSSGFPNLSKMSTNPPNSGWPPSSGNVTSPGPFNYIAITPLIAAGTYNVKWVVSLSGTLGAGDGNNFQLYLQPSGNTPATLLATSSNGFGANLYNQADALNVVVPTGGGQLVIKNINAGTVGAVYGGIILPQDPGIGSVQTSTNPNPASDSELNSSSNWTLHIRSVDDDRYPLLPFHIARSETPQSVFLLDIGDYLQIPDGPIWLPNGPIKQLAAGFQETYFPAAHGVIEINGIPELPYEVAVTNSGAQRLASAGSYLSLAYTYGNTSLSVAPYPGSLTTWTVNPADFPFNIVMAGMILQVTNITGGFGIQTFTVGATSLNGVVKNLPIGTPVQVASPMVVAW